MFDFFAQIDAGALQEQLSSASAQQEQSLAFIKEMQDRILALLPFIVAGSIAIAITFIISAINRMRVDRAILRIDKNLQKLVTEKALKEHGTSDVPYPNMYGPRPSVRAEVAAEKTGGTPDTAIDEGHKPPKDWLE